MEDDTAFKVTGINYYSKLSYVLLGTITTIVQRSYSMRVQCNTLESNLLIEHDF